MATETGDGTGEETADTGGTAETDDGVSPYIRSITVTTASTAAGMVAGIAAHLVTTAPDDITGVLVLLVAIIVQYPIYKLVGIDTSDFGTKDQLYIGFMTFTLWFVTWGILMTAGSLQ
jgi:hypothetical protein